MAGGQEGVERCLSIIESQIIRTMKLLGVKDLKELTPKQVKILDRLQ
jgi:isopentenyl diphosphate isomerase/L-lactate dehydrogenase-like FMN-dependent dehydrogenase